MNIHISALDYELLDSGLGFRYERFGRVRLVRPEPRATWKTREPFSLWQPHAEASKQDGGSYSWECCLPFDDPWDISFGEFVFSLRLSQSKHIGIFPEQEANWHWLSETLNKQMQGKALKVLNLFGYTGVSTVLMASSGALVTHVDASRSAINRAKENCTKNQIPDNQVRFVTDDAMDFVRREIRRGNRYDAIILDPPPFGRSKKGSFSWESQFEELLKLCKEVLVERPLFFLLNVYAVPVSGQELEKLVGKLFRDRKVEVGSLGLQEKKRAQTLELSHFVRVT
jgi:23S rRNA (cytosine1962-C5)-methyltransferase